jgi:hypothetical protein
MSRSDVVGLAKQTAFGTMNTTPSYYVPVESADTSQNQETMSIDETIGNRFALDPDYGSRTFGVTLAGAVHPTSFPRILSGFMGADTMTTPSGGVTARQHAFDPVANPSRVWHSMLVGRNIPSTLGGAVTDLYYDCLGDSLGMTVEANNYMRYTASFVGRKLDTAQTFPVSPTVDSSSKFPFYQVIAYMTIGAGAEAAFNCSTASVTLNNNIDADYVVLGSTDVYDVQFGNAAIDVSFEIREALGTHYRESQTVPRTKHALRIVATGALIEGAINYVVEFNVPRFFYNGDTSLPVAAGDAAWKGMTVTGTASYDSATSKAITARVVNTVSTAY